MPVTSFSLTPNHLVDNVHFVHQHGTELRESVGSQRQPEFRTGDEPRKQAEYEPPVIITYTSEEIAEQIGPAQACSPSPCPVTP